MLLLDKKTWSDSLQVEVSAISSGETVERLLKEMEDDYASRFGMMASHFLKGRCLQ